MINSALVVLLGGGGVWAWSLLNGDAQTQTTSSTARTAAVAQGQVTATVTASGTVASATTMNANFVTSGTVTSIRVKLGDKVTKGQVLAKVDDTETAESLATARANLTAAKEAKTRANATDNDDTIANAAKQVRSAQTAVDSAQRAQDGTTLKAPMAGTVVVLTGTVGGPSSGASSGGTGTGGSTTSSAFAQIADLSKLQVNASVPEADATRLKTGQAATVTWNALTATRVQGTVGSISPTSATSGGVISYPIVVALASVPEKAKLGQSVALSVTVDKVEDAIYVPAAAVKTTAGISVVTVVVNGAQSTRTVQIGLEGDSYTQITDGLEVGELVVIATVTTGTNPFGGGNFPGGGGGQFPGGGGGFGGGNR